MPPATTLTFGIEQVPGDDTFTELLEGIGVRVADIVPIYDALYSVFRKIEQRRFDKEGPGWAELAESTVAGRERLGIGGSHPILNRKGVTYRGRRGGQLRTSLTTKGAKGAIVEPIPDGLFMGTSDPLAAVHQKGTSRAGRDHNVVIPARPLVDMTEADAEEFSEVVARYMFGIGLRSHTTSDASALFEAETVA